MPTRRVKLDRRAFLATVAAAGCERVVQRDQQNEPDVALGEAKVIINPRVEEFREQGHAAVRKKEFEEAVRAFSEAIRLDPTDALTYHHRAGAQRLKGADEAAIVDYSEALRRDPKMAGAYSGRGLVWTNRGDFEKAIHDLDEATRLAPDDANVWGCRGYMWLLN